MAHQRIATRHFGVLVLLGLGLQTGYGVAQTSPPATAGAASASGRQGPGLITTHAEAKRRLPNTVSDAAVSIEVHGRDLPNTASALGKQSQVLLAYLQGQPIERLRTEGTSFDPEIQDVRGQPDRIKGYTGRLSVSFRTTPERLPALLAGCLENGATGLGQFGSSPREREIEAARQEMVTEAGQGALDQARAIAATVGQRIAGVEFVDVDPQPGLSTSPVRMPLMVQRAARPSPSVQPVANEAGDSNFAITVVMTLRLAPPQ